MRQVTQNPNSAAASTSGANRIANDGESLAEEAAGVVTGKLRGIDEAAVDGGRANK
jgi:hypothetical protein